MADTNTNVAKLNAETLKQNSSSLWEITWRRLFKRRSAMIGMVVLCFLIFIAIAAPLIAPYGYDEVLIGKETVTSRQLPCIHLLGCPTDQPQHLAGIDGNVRDQFSRIIYGARLSLMVGFSTVSFSIVI